MNSRVKTAIFTILLLIIGYLSRQFSSKGSFAHDYLGDAIWAGMIYLGFRFVFIDKPIKWALLAALVFCFGIEVSQFCQQDWLNEIRANKLGGLILGFGFQWSDLGMYVFGIFAVCFFAELDSM